MVDLLKESTDENSEAKEKSENVNISDEENEPLKASEKQPSLDDDQKEEEPFVKEDIESEFEDEVKGEDEFEFDDDDLDSDYKKVHLLLDKDKKIAKILRTKQFKNIQKIISTDQGSTWRAKKGKENQSVVIKVASKLLYETVEEEKKKGVEAYENILKEIEILKMLNAEQQKLAEEDRMIIELIEVLDTVDDEDNYMVVLEDGGSDLFTFTTKVHEDINAGQIDIADWQKTVRLIARRLSKLLDWMHSKMLLCHLDLSLENVLISNIEWIHYIDDHDKKYKKRLSSNFKLRLIDFGVCQQFDKSVDESGKVSFSSSRYVGKPSYCSPQIFNLRKSDKQFDARGADIFSFGVTLFILMIGCPPWAEPDQNNPLFQTIVLFQRLDFVLKGWKRQNYANAQMKDLLQRIFVMAEEDRISIQDIRKHPWLAIV